VQKLIAIAIAALTPFLGLGGLGGAGQAQAQTAAEVQGTIEAVDCNSGNVTLDYAGTAETVDASDTTAVAVGDSSVPFCSLEGYVGAPADAWVVPYGDQFLATQIDVTGPVAVVPVATEAIAPLPIIGSVLGTVLTDGLLYLLVNDGGVYYQYPYYGAYYHHYYSTRYRPYRGWWPSSAPIISAAQAITGSILGVVVVNNYQYLAVRDRDGRINRYPYYGPYRSYYSGRYHPATRTYVGTFASAAVRAPVAQGYARWDAPRSTMQHFSQTIRPSASRPSPWSAPHRTAATAPVTHAPARTIVPWTQPGQQRPQVQPQARPTFQRPQAQPQARPTFQRPQAQPQARPTFQPQPQARPIFQQPQPQFQRPQVQPQPQARPTFQPQPQARPAFQQRQPQFQRPQVQPQPQARPTVQQPQPQGRPSGGGGSRGQQCDPRAQNCGQHP
jgi:hypothetical protein